LKVDSSRPSCLIPAIVEQLGDVVGPPQPAHLTVVAVAAEQVEGRVPQRGQHGQPGAAIRVFIFMELGIADSQCQLSMTAVPSPVAAGLLALVRRLVRKSAAGGRACHDAAH